jgi:hypothetical protein
MTGSISKGKPSIYQDPSHAATKETDTSQSLWIVKKWPEAYEIPNQEASTVAEALVTKYFCRLGVPRELHSDQGGNFRVSSHTGIVTPGIEQDAHHAPAPAVGGQGRAVY